jgi:transcriptional regulator with XRE-family HTH domain
MIARIGSNTFRKRPTFFKEWRVFRGLTQDEVIARLDALGVEFSKPSISRIENGHQPYSEPILLALAEVYGCEPSDLIGRNPTWGRSVDLALSALPEADRARVVSMVEAFLKAS